ncbi:MAG TPA: PIG-L family deacetylase [Planctomycetota bacterium]|nr:PIG-L family deacetylase [Planctomycetota bacterium]
MSERTAFHAAVVVAHPDDETLWAGGTILMHPERRWRVVTLCRASDPDRAPKFARALGRLGARGQMADLDDAPDQTPLDPSLVRSTVLSLLGDRRFDLLLTHGLHGEYTRHRRHEETARAVLALWACGELDVGEVHLFAYDDDGGRRLPRAVESADLVVKLPLAVWAEKHAIITDVYGFTLDSFEAKTTPRVEAFQRVRSAGDARTCLETRGGAL